MDNKKFIYACSLVLTTSGLTLSPLSAEATELRYAVGFPAGVPLEAAREYSSAVSELTDGQYSVRIFELSLLNHSEMSSGIGDGMADIGYLLTAYSPSDYPFSNLGADMSMQLALDDRAEGKEGFSYSGAMLEYILLNCPECLNEFKANNQVYTGVVSTPIYGMFCNDPVTTVADMEGKRIRISGAPWARWVKNFDASPTALPIGESYEALSQGVVDCTLFSAPELTNFNLIEVVENINMDLPGGLFAAGGATTLNRDRWNSFDDDTKHAMLKAGSVMSSYVTYLYQEQANQDLEAAEEHGINIISADEAFLEASKEFIRNDLETIPSHYANEYGIDQERAEELAEIMSGLIDKWQAIVSDIDDPDQLAEVYWDEIYSKIDHSEYATQ